MPSDKAAYLAAHYLTVEKPTSSTKKRKRKHNSKSASGLLITDDDDWSISKNPGGDNSDEDPDVTVAGHSAEFRRAKKSAWKTVGAPIPTDTKDARDADAIIAAAAAESAAATAAADEAPTMDIDVPVPSAALMSNGTLAGLQSASDITAQLKARQELERAELAQLQAQRAAGKDEEEVVLRDATGRRVDISMRRAEARRQALEAQKQEEEKQRLLKGEVQLQAAKERKEKLEEAALMPLARGKDDAELNRELKEQERWNDPMAQFMVGDTGGGTGKKKKGGVGRRPVYKGAAPPNRYGIKPGYRWDGVDRGNGFEAERFKAINRREMNKGLEYAWQMDE
ncbi:putative pre-mRNA splicing protein [Cladorrhinum samala]|uniref:Pre-mRNA splicing protein n=1 Tax=Cladorrhinum samala TaxID=585594 RepID=A0AAV9HIM6_9PEZI|nr:putative pre-mRNA splicing protein [Cladorrhinum samala]